MILLRNLARQALLWILCGVLAGAAATIFLVLLNHATSARQANPWLIWLLPLGGFLIGWIYYRHGKNVAGGHNLILEEIHSELDDPRRVIPFRMAPFVLLGTIITHLFGGSAGREGTAVQMSASLADQLTGPFRLSAAERKKLLVAGAGAGFSAAIGAPWAGMIFGMEMARVGRLRLFAVPECFIASFVAYFTTVALRAPHSSFPAIEVPAFSLELLGAVLLGGAAFGIAARAFIALTHAIERLQARWVPYPPLKPLLGGLILIGLYHLEGSFRFAGLGLEVIQQALHTPASPSDPALKALFTSITVATGFKGGEFIPLVFIGTTLGSFLSGWLDLGPGLIGALGFAAVFSGASNTPIACTLMAAEIFGWRIAPYALLACGVSFLVSGSTSIYHSRARSDFS